MPLEFFAPGIFVEEVPWRARPVRAADRWFDGHERPAAPTADSSSADQHGEPGLRVPEQPVMLVLKNRRDGPWGLPF